MWWFGLLFTHMQLLILWIIQLTKMLSYYYQKDYPLANFCHTVYYNFMPTILGEQITSHHTYVLHWMTTLSDLIVNSFTRICRWEKIFLVIWWMCRVACRVGRSYPVVLTSVYVSVTKMPACLTARFASSRALRREPFVITCVPFPVTQANRVPAVNVKQW